MFRHLLSGRRYRACRSPVLPAEHARADVMAASWSALRVRSVALPTRATMNRIPAKECQAKPEMRTPMERMRLTEHVDEINLAAPNRALVLALQHAATTSWTLAGTLETPAR